MRNRFLHGLRQQIANRWIECVVLLAAGVKLAAGGLGAGGTGPGHARRPHAGAREVVVVTTHALPAGAAFDRSTPIGGALDPAPLAVIDHAVERAIAAGVREQVRARAARSLDARLLDAARRLDDDVPCDSARAQRRRRLSPAAPPAPSNLRHDVAV